MAHRAAAFQLFLYKLFTLDFSLNRFLFASTFSFQRSVLLTDFLLFL